MFSILGSRLEKKITARTATVGIIGLGYVGSALAQLIAKKGFFVFGFEKEQEKIEKINKRNDTKLVATADMSQLSSCDIIIVCIQTPIREDKTPDLTFLEKAVKQIRNFLKPGQLITIESSINPGITRNVVLPLLQQHSADSEKKEFFLSFSPERMDPGNMQYPLEHIPKIVSGIDEDSLSLIQAFYKKIFNKVVPVSSLETAEMVKVFENTFRFINISLVNEIKEYTKHVGIDTWEVIGAAATKPFGFLAHYPGPGVGGHCIPVDPFYLYYDAKKRNIDLSFIRTAQDVNDQQPYNIVEQTLTVLYETHIEKAYQDISQEDVHPKIAMQKHVGMKGGESRTKKGNALKYNILLVGIAYKANIDDVRESPAIKIWKLFEKLGHTVSYHDPFVKNFGASSSVPLSQNVLENHDIFVIITNHNTIDYDYLAAFGKPIIDTRHVYSDQLPNIFYV